MFLREWVRSGIRGLPAFKRAGATECPGVGQLGAAGLKRVLLDGSKNGTDYHEERGLWNQA